MAMKSEEIASFLKSRQLFKDLDENDILKIAERIGEIKFSRDDLLFSEGDPGDIFYIIFSGKIQIWVQEESDKFILANLERGDKFGEEALLYNRPRSASATVIEDSILLTIYHQDFNWMLRTYPETKFNLRTIAQAHQEARKQRFDWLNKGEVIYMITRRHPAELWVDLAKPAITATLGLFILFFYTISGSVTLAIIASTIIIFSILWGIWEGIDWRNDYFMITNQRVIWLEVVLFQRASREEAPMSMIQSVNFTTSQIGRWLGFGNVVVRTYTGTGSLSLNFVNNPKQFKDIIDEQLIRVRRKTEQAKSEAMRQSIRESLGLAPPTKINTAPGMLDTDPEPEKRLKIFSTRDVDGSTITYHKHWWVLLIKVLLPLVGLPAILFLNIYTFFLAPTSESSFSAVAPTSICILSFLGFSVLFGLLLYHYFDWKNDLYRITKDTIIDSEKKPFGKEVTKSAPIKNVQSLNYERNGILRLMMNFGTVNINVADSILTFKDVHKPAQASRDISYRLEHIKYDEEEAAAEKERTRMSEWMSAYHEVWVKEQQPDQIDDDPSNEITDSNENQS